MLSPHKFPILCSRLTRQTARLQPRIIYHTAGFHVLNTDGDVKRQSRIAVQDLRHLFPNSSVTVETVWHGDTAHTVIDIQGGFIDSDKYATAFEIMKDLFMGYSISTSTTELPILVE
ncbi:hypothetical protein CGCF415_v009677 [Colletotrichum fructicola]|nr:hypothetical protein CGCFRS4_v008095 [Colletotrichum fructicola]KAF4901713.1 hypothetical protein CGCF415_v009677 [Colletotrichum fructicola]KAF4935047.1 hypothetical protein CGCF245_v008057 [Colletotrichum fructicola]